MAGCVRAIERMQGGLVVCPGDEVLAELPLPIGGLLSDQKAEAVIQSLKKMNEGSMEPGLQPACAIYDALVHFSANCARAGFNGYGFDRCK